MRIWIALALSASLGALGCASTGTTSGTAKGRSSSRLAKSEIETTNLTSAYDVVSTLRPAWLRPPGMTTTGLGVTGGNSTQKQVLVYLDGMRLGGIESLRTITTSAIASMEYLSPTEATTRVRDNGAQIASALILVMTR